MDHWSLGGTEPAAEQAAEAAVPPDRRRRGCCAGSARTAPSCSLAKAANRPCGGAGLATSSGSAVGPMSVAEVVFSVALGVVVNEISDLSPWLARRLMR